MTIRRCGLGAVSVICGEMPTTPAQINARHLVTVAGRPVTLTANEYGLLRVLARGAGRVLTFKAPIRQVWHDRNGAHPKVVRAFVKQVRRKRGDDASNPVWIVNFREVGYLMEGRTAAS